MEYQAPLLTRPEITTTYSKKFLSIGELFITDGPTHVWTVLGSCVSVVLHNPRKKVSAICHAQLTEKEIFTKYNSTEHGDFRYIACSINYMLEQLAMMGINKNEIYASIYGGSKVIEKFSHKVGEENATAAVEVLEKHGIRIVRKDIGGGKSRTIRHFSDTGETHVKML